MCKGKISLKSLVIKMSITKLIGSRKSCIKNALSGLNVALIFVKSMVFSL